MPFKPLIFLVILIIQPLISNAQSEQDIKIFNSVSSSNKNKKSIELRMSIAQSLIGTSYVGHTLENKGPEKLVINLRGLDCLTFVENVLALESTIESRKLTMDEFKNKLTQLRYRDGKINGYESRLHYLTDWIMNNEKKGLVKNITSQFSCVQERKVINFMSSNRKLYPKLLNKNSFNEIRSIEKNLSQTNWCIIPKSKVNTLESELQEGDIIAILTQIKNLDASHLGFVKKVNGKSYLLHASSDFKRVMITEQPLSDYLKSVRNHRAILVIHPY
jgi:hypothetical protein